MKMLKTPFFVFAILCSAFSIHAQSDASTVSKRALLFADSIVSAFHYGNWDQYLSMSNPGVVQYYGGKKNFQDYVQRSRISNDNLTDETPEKIQIQQLVNDASEWQCVVKKTKDAFVDGKKAVVVSYMVGQSSDGGLSWKYVDMANNSVDNIVYIMPDAFATLAIPQRHIIYEKQDIARTQ